MNYTLTTPCAECPFLEKFKDGYPIQSLIRKASGEFPCHKTAKLVDSEEGGSEYTATKDSLHCAGALIFNELRNKPHQMMRICERLGFYDATKLNMKAEVRRA